MRFLNINAKRNDQDCRKVIHELHVKIKTLAPTDSLNHHFTKYAAIICSGALERSFKSIIADYVTKNATPQICEFIDRKIRRASTNPRLDAISAVLKEFDDNWNSQYKNLVARFSSRKTDALRSLVENRNAVAHGLPIAVSFFDIAHYYYNARDVIGALELVLI